MTPVTMFSGVNGALKVAGPTSGVATIATGGGPAAGRTRVTVRAGLEVVLIKPRTLGDCAIEAVLAEFPWEIRDLEATDDEIRGDLLGPPSTSAFGGDFSAVLPVST
jgi:hypothetical protein